MIWSIDENPEAFQLKLNSYVMVDGSFDPLHEGHIAYFRQSTAFKFPVACLIAPEDYTIIKHPVLLPIEIRAKVLESIKFLDVVIVSQMATSKVIKLLGPRIYFKGGDWIDKLPRDIVQTCEDIGCEIRFGDLPLNSSSRIVNDFRKELKNEF